ncbi:hypothetical protein L3Y34_017460 [Caenorhabditis briggsae]|uniref:Nematode Specific Peptide family, group B n=3 Tax=Caenorhabditis briggsae TaxID=6238 RepID=A0AAE9IT98_CAEBR|nr:hypothetical protein L3Y34_017460 [Caenorhabditis briggsae]
MGIKSENCGMEDTSKSLLPFNMFAKCIIALVLCSMMIGFSHQQVVVPAYSAAYYPSAYAYPSVYSPYLTAAAYPSVWAWGSNKNKANAGNENAPAPSLVNNKPFSA